MHLNRVKVKSTTMEAVPTYQVYTKRKLQTDPGVGKYKRHKRLGYRTFHEDELKQLDEVLHESNLDLEGNTQIKLIRAHFYVFILRTVQGYDE